MPIYCAKIKLEICKQGFKERTINHRFFLSLHKTKTAINQAKYFG